MLCRLLLRNRNVFQFFPGLKKLSESKTIDLIIGGPPCQAYSIAGRIRDKDGMKNDYRNYLFESFTKIVSTLKPKIFIIPVARIFDKRCHISFFRHIRLNEFLYCFLKANN